MATPYSLFSPSPFDVDLMVDDTILHSTPNRLELRYPTRPHHTFSKSVRMHQNAKFEILVRHEYCYPHPLRDNSNDYNLQWLVVTVIQLADRSIEPILDWFLIPFVRQEDRSDRKFKLRLQSNEPEVGQGGLGSPFQSPARSAADWSKGHLRAYEYISHIIPNGWDVAVSFWHTSAPCLPEAHDKLLDTFLVSCLDPAKYAEVWRNAMQCPVASSFFRATVLQRELETSIWKGTCVLEKSQSQQEQQSQETRIEIEETNEVHGIDGLL